ncbi:uncharacterized protein BDCG_06085 [Blastomyces dermatitidis ER-3]|uniref:Uncharacterized protein n=1 Tax=Ajellomyces dermatitidis (strain ER-3 / ATCC MYA-2586) TaxID=559297 RepID=A0ABM9YID7_AJEDR|nr:uncharacterized protein BDCG_06085 [Blastomyces dermatitidis ER-3]EEQ90965.1 hypothetical protein BDCG_06085 [Blastomyces dermatitidis ER-3]
MANEEKYFEGMYGAAAFIVGEPTSFWQLSHYPTGRVEFRYHMCASLKCVESGIQGPETHARTHAPQLELLDSVNPEVSPGEKPCEPRMGKGKYPGAVRTHDTHTALSLLEDSLARKDEIMIVFPRHC